MTKEINFNGQIIEIDPAKFYIVELNAKEVEPAQADYIREELKLAGIKAGLIVGTPSGKAITVKEQSDGRAE